MHHTHPSDDEPEIGDDFFGADDLAGPTAEELAEVPVRVPPRLGLLANLTTKEFDVVARAAQLRFREAGHVVFSQGEPADRFFILVDGEVEVVRDGETIGVLGPGSFFGESALLVRGNRSATVRVRSAASLWSVDYAAFDGVVSQQLLADEQARREVQERIEQAPPGSFA